jgi:hypothetical protein
MAFGELIAPASGFNAMMGRFYDEFGKVQDRNATAFGYYEDEKKREQDKYMADVYERQRQRKMQEQDRSEASNDRERMRSEHISPKQAHDAMVTDEEKRRMRAIRASSGRTFQYGTNPSANNVVADYYEYGAGRGAPAGADNKGIDPREMTCPPGTKLIGNQCVQPELYGLG